MKRLHWVFGFGIVLLFACNRQPVIRDSSKVVVQPGHGIPHVCELGMTLKQLRDGTRDVSTHGIYDGEWSCRRWTVSRHALIQSLGAIAPIEKGKKFQVFCFYVMPYHNEAPMQGLSVTNPFRGMVGTNLSFAHGLISRTDVEAQFGNVDQVVTNLWDGVPIAMAGKAFLYRGMDGSERLYYRHRGIDFDLKSNVVTSFWIYEPAQTRSSSPGSKDQSAKSSGNPIGDLVK